MQSLRFLLTNWIWRESQKNQRKNKDESRSISRVLSRTVIHLGRASPCASSNLPGPSADRAIGSLFGLAPGGVYPAIRVATNAVRSYRTISPLPRTHLDEMLYAANFFIARYKRCSPNLPSRWVRGGIFSVALSVGLRRPGVTWHLVLRSPDFPPRHPPAYWHH